MRRRISRALLRLQSAVAPVQSVESGGNRIILETTLLKPQWSTCVVVDFALPSVLSLGHEVVLSEVTGADARVLGGRPVLTRHPSLPFLQ